MVSYQVSDQGLRIAGALDCPIDKAAIRGSDVISDRNYADTRP